MSNKEYKKSLNQQLKLLIKRSKKADINELPSIVDSEIRLGKALGLIITSN